MSHRPREDDPLVGRTIDERYLVEARVSSGGMGAVYRARRVGLDRRLALKVLAAQGARVDVAVERFVREARVVAAIEHPHVVRSHDFGRLPDGRLYFVMDFVEGPSLERVIEAETPLGPERAVEFTRQIADALDAVHAVQVVHRDIKPSNVIVTGREPDRRLRVVDFGIALVTDVHERLTATGVICGTPMYVSPEQARGQSIDARADLYSLGCVLYEMLTGKAPFAHSRSVADLLLNHVTVTPEPPSARGAPASLDPIVMRLLGKDPDERFPSAKALLGALSDWKREHGVHHGALVDEDRISLADTMMAPGPRIPHPEPTERDLGDGPAIAAGDASPKTAGRRAGVAIAAAVGLAAAGAIAYATWPGSTEPARPIDPVAAHPAAPPARGAVPAVPPAPPAPALTVEVRSDPPGAEVVVDGAVIGNTPMALRRPPDDGERELELRLRDHRPTTLRIGPGTPASTTAVLVAATEAEPGASRPPASRRSPRPPASTPPAAMEVQAPPAEEHPSVQGVVDPWGG